MTAATLHSGRSTRAFDSFALQSRKLGRPHSVGFRLWVDLNRSPRRWGMTSICALERTSRIDVKGPLQIATADIAVWGEIELWIGHVNDDLSHKRVVRHRANDAKFSQRQCTSG